MVGARSGTGCGEVRGARLVLGALQVCCCLEPVTKPRDKLATVHGPNVLFRFKNEALFAVLPVVLSE